MQPIVDARKAEDYYGKSDGGYYLRPEDRVQEWLGKGAAMLGLTGPPEFEQFQRLLRGLDPQTGRQLTARLIDDRLPGWDVNVSAPKGVTTAMERGDDRLRAAMWEAGREAIADIEQSATTRVRKGGKMEDRVTGNLVGFGVEHYEGRPTQEDHMPDWQRHLHLVVFN